MLTADMQDSRELSVKKLDKHDLAMAVNLFGVPARVVRTVGGVGSIVGAVIGFPFFEDIVKLLFKKSKKQNR